MKRFQARVFAVARLAACICSATVYTHAAGDADTQQQMIAHLTKEQAEAKDALAREYERCLKRLIGEGERARLIRTQEAWLAYEQLQCDAEYKALAGGSLAPAQLLVCRIRLAKARISEIGTICGEPPSPTEATRQE